MYAVLCAYRKGIVWSVVIETFYLVPHLDPDRCRADKLVPLRFVFMDSDRHKPGITKRMDP